MTQIRVNYYRPRGEKLFIKDKTFQNEHKVEEGGTTSVYRAQVVKPYFYTTDEGVALKGRFILNLVDEVEKAGVGFVRSFPPIGKIKRKKRMQRWTLDSEYGPYITDSGGETIHSDKSYGYKYAILSKAREQGIFSLTPSLLEDICKPIDEAVMKFYKENTVGK